MLADALVHMAEFGMVDLASPSADGAAQFDAFAELFKEWAGHEMAFVPDAHRVGDGGVHRRRHGRDRGGDERDPATGARGRERAAVRRQRPQIASAGDGPASDRHVRQRLRRAHGGPRRHRPAAGRGHRLRRRHRPVPVRLEAAGRRRRVRAPDRPVPDRRTRRQGDRRRLQHRRLGRRPRPRAPGPGGRRDRAGRPRPGVGHPVGSRGRHRHRGHRRFGLVPAGRRRRGRRPRCDRDRARLRRVSRASSSSSSEAWSPATRSPCSPSGCSPRCARPRSTPCSSGARTTRTSPASSAR